MPPPILGACCNSYATRGRLARDICPRYPAIQTQRLRQAVPGRGSRDAAGRLGTCRSRCAVFNRAITAIPGVDEDSRYDRCDSLPYTLWGETADNTSPDLEDEQAAITSHAKDIYEIADELSILEESFKQQLATPLSLGNKPLIVLTAGPLQSADTSLSQEQIEQIGEAHTRTQATLTQGSQNAEQILAGDSGHSIQVEQPDLVIDAIRRVVEAARNGGSV